MKSPTILLIDDEPDILEFLRYNLEKANFEVHLSSHGREGLEKAKKIKPDLILLDVMMPEMDGIETCFEIRSTPSLKKTLVAFLSARAEDYSQIAGFNAGADDYIRKPIRPKVLISRINALLRRSQKNIQDTIIHIAGIEIDKEKYEVKKQGKQLDLPKKEFELLSLLSSRPNKVFSREEIFDQIWGDEVIIGDRTIDVHIRKLREKLGMHTIKTYKGVGYAFSAQS